MLTYEEIKKVGEELVETVDTPFLFPVVCSLNEKLLYTLWTKANTYEMAVFITIILEVMFDNQANHDLLIDAYEKVREYLKIHGGHFRPTNENDFEER